ncbi:MAG TPA: 4,5-DOPA dioxygenase extradiol [Clostridiaceae bacterium]
MPETKKMPVLFVGHGNPMNAIEDNEYSREWIEIAKKIPKPDAILSVSAHWYTNGTKVSDAAKPETVYDMYGFPDELYQVTYNATGAPELAHKIKDMLSTHVEIDNSWGIDHGTWSVLHRMYPKADIPVLQLSVDSLTSFDAHFRIGRELSSLREKGVLIMGSGNIVHNLAMAKWGMDSGFSWADEFDAYIRDKIINRQYEDVINYGNAGKSSEMAFFTPEHFYPLLYVLGASPEEDKITIFNESCTMGSMSMTSYLFE